jgi:CHASE1-domain containing sensor protein
MDTAKYPNRTTCAISQYQEAATYVFTKYADYLKARMERKIERQQKALSGTLNNFQSGITR